MAIDVMCKCGKSYRVSDDKVGRRFKCRECGTLVGVPQANANASDETVREDTDWGLEPEAEYVPAHRRRWARCRSAKQDVRTKKNAAARNRWLLIAGAITVVALVIGVIVWVDAHLRPEQKNVLWITVGVPAFYLLRDQLGRHAIRRTLHSYGETVQSISWRPFKNFFKLNGSWPPHLFFYEVRYIDQNGNARSREVAFVRRRGMVWDDDI